MIHFHHMKKKAVLFQFLLVIHLIFFSLFLHGEENPDLLFHKIVERLSREAIDLSDNKWAVRLADDIAGVKAADGSNLNASLLIYLAYDQRFLVI